MINVIHGVGANAFDALIYPEQSIANQMYFQNQINTFSNTLSDFGRGFMEAARAAYDKINSSEAIHLAKVAIQAAKGLLNPNVVTPLQSLAQLQAATPVMQRWVMACPEVREVYHQQRCDGYSETYVDLYPDQVGENHYDYRRVMNGMVQEDGDSWIVNQYPDELVEGDRELLHQEQDFIISSWNLAKLFMEAKKDDPTNQFGGKL